MSAASHKLGQLLRKNPDGSYATQEERKKILLNSIKHLHQLGFRVNNPAALKPKHGFILVEHWKNSKLSVGTIKNRASHLRWLADRTNNNFMKNGNYEYGLGNRSHVPVVSKAIEFSLEQLGKIEDPYVRVSAELQKEFGLRKEEAIKFSPSFADRKTHIELKGSWTKGGRGRIIEIRTESQREAIRKAHNLAGMGSLIPAKKSYKSQMKRFEKQMEKVGYGNSHGARHHYAQSRYKELTGHDCKLNGGLSRRELSGDRKEQDTLAREIISAELGHGRIGIVANYLGG